MRLKGVSDELAALADLPPVSSQALTEWRAALDAAAVLDREMSTLEAADAADAVEIDAMAVNETLLSEGHSIDALRERLAAAGKHQQIILFTHHKHVVNLARTVQDHLIDFIGL